MPELVPVTNNFFVNLITRLGLKPPPNLGWTMQTVLVPVSLVDSDITLSAISSTINCDTPFTAGPLAAGTAANTVHADSGSQAAGNYAVLILMSADMTAGTFQTFLIQRRDAANAANIWEQEYAISTGNLSQSLPLTITLAANERLRVVNRSISNFTLQQVSIFLRPA